MTEPVNRTLLLLDIERFSERDDIQQGYLRRMLYGVVDALLRKADIDQTRHLRADRGDGVLVMIDANAPVPGLLRALLHDVGHELRAVNRLASSSAQIRLRAVLATGFVAVDEFDGWVGTDLNTACRLLDGDLLRAALRERADDFALCIADQVHAGIVRHGHPGIPAEQFRPVDVPSKNGRLQAWLYGPLPQGVPAPEPEGDSGAGRGSAPAAHEPPRPPAPQPRDGVTVRGDVTGGVIGLNQGSIGSIGDVSNITVGRPGAGDLR
ncbi:hypothetical protein [Streptomyces sp. NPDC097981]|uniref:hypothetical protein n=1 Tax=Streptomyces sp. NPDC097981 TaxID=3155428 RepID=UPI00333363ED